MASEVVGHVDILLDGVVQVVLNPELELTARVQRPIHHLADLIRHFEHLRALYMTAVLEQQLDDAGFRVHVHLVEIAFSDLERARFDDHYSIAHLPFLKHNTPRLVIDLHLQLRNEISYVFKRPSANEFNLSQETGLSVDLFVGQASDHGLIHVPWDLHTESLRISDDHSL